MAGRNRPWLYESDEDRRRWRRDNPILAALSKKTTHLLREAGVNDDGAFLRISDDDVLDIRNVGPSTLREINEARHGRTPHAQTPERPEEV